MKPLILTILAVALLIPFPCAAQFQASPELKTFFKALQAEIIMPVEGGVLLNRGAGDHVAIGDIFTAVTAEKQLIHPQTGVLLDTQRTYGSQCEIIRIKQDLAYCKQLDKHQQTQAGGIVRRFENVPVYFEDSSGNGFQLFRNLRESFPHLRWQEYRDKAESNIQSTKPVLRVSYTGSDLQILNQQGTLLYIEKTNTNAALGTGAMISTAGVAGSPSAASKTATASQVGRVPDETLRLKLPADTEVQAISASNLDNNGPAEIIVGLDGALLIGQLKNGEFVEITRLELRNHQKITDISALDIDRDGYPEIIVSALENDEVHSLIYRYTENKLHEVTSSRLLFGAFSPGKGPEILLGMDKNSLLSQQQTYHRISLNGQTIVKEDFSLPGARQLYGITQINEEKQSYLVQMTGYDRLKITNSKNESIWTSDNSYGGSTTYIKTPLDGSKSVDFDKLFLKSTIKKTSAQTLLVTKHDGQNILKNSPELKKGQIAELKWNGFSLDEIWASEILGGRIADFTLADIDQVQGDEIVAAVVYTPRSFFKKPVSGLVIIKKVSNNIKKF